MCEPISEIISYPNGSKIFISGVETFLSPQNLFKKYNIKVIASVLNDQVPNMNDFGIMHFFFRLEDTPRARKKFFELIPKVYQLILYSIKNRKNILVHCAAGISRSVSMVIAFFIMCLRCNPELVIPYIPKTRDTWTESILDFIRKKRFCANPNAGFLMELKKLEIACTSYVRR